MRVRAALAMVVLLTSACTTSYVWRPGRLERDTASSDDAAGAPAQDPSRSLPSGSARPSEPLDLRGTVEQTRWAPSFLFGLIGRSFVDVRDVCPGPVAQRLRTGITVPTFLVSVVTLGVYTPIEHRFECVIPPPGPLFIPRVTLEESAPLEPEEPLFETFAEEQAPPERAVPLEDRIPADDDETLEEEELDGATADAPGLPDPDVDGGGTDDAPSEEERDPATSGDAPTDARGAMKGASSALP